MKRIMVRSEVKDALEALAKKWKVSIPEVIRLLLEDLMEKKL